MTARLGWVAVALLGVAPFARAGEPAWRAHPEVAARLAAVRVVAVARPDVRAYELQVGGKRELRADWTAQAADAVQAAVVEELRARGLDARPFAPPAGAAEELRDVDLLWDAVAGAILQATYVDRFPAKVARFEYTVGDLGPLLAPGGADALVLVRGTANISSGGRKALQVLGALVGPGYSVGLDHLLVGIVDRTGAVIWFGRGSSTQHDLRDARSAQGFVGEVTGPLQLEQR